MSKNTIVALATPPGKSGIGVIRLSGDSAIEITRKIVHNDNFSPEPRRVALRDIFDFDSKQLIDKGLITYFKSPHSFTGEDVIEISCHGAPVLLRQVIDVCLKLGARLAEPGEFSLRALENGKLDLSQAEAIRDLIDSQTVASARQSARQLRGELSDALQPLKNDLLDVIVVLESSLEFVEDDLPDFQTENLAGKLIDISERLGRMAATFRAGKLLREGLTIALVGRPNVGKSSLFNALIGRERAIVTEIAGTTRDSLYEPLSIKGVPVSLIDTAGLRETSDKVEGIGVERTKKIIADSDLTIMVLDSSEKFEREDEEILSDISGLNHLIAVNKCDLNDSKMDLAKIPIDSKFVKISAKTGEGLELLKDLVIEPYFSSHFDNTGFLITNARHFDLLCRAKSQIEFSYSLLKEKVSEELILTGLHNAIKLLGEITGEVTTEDMLTRVFSTFCIGK